MALSLKRVLINKKMAVEKIATAMLAYNDIILGEVVLLIFYYLKLKHIVT